MKLNTNLILLSLVVFVATARATNQTNAITDFRIGVSPFLSQSDRSAFALKIRRLALLQAPNGSRIRCDDAFNLQTISEIKIPQLRYDSIANRHRLIGNSLASFTSWLEHCPTNPPAGGFANAIRVPEYLDYVSAETAARPRAIILVGSPLMQYENEPTFSMSASEFGPRVPSDGNLLAARQSSPYGTADRRDRLKKSRIAWCYLRESTWSNPLHRVLVQRFWSLFTQREGGALVAFNADLQNVLTAAQRPDAAPVEHPSIDTSDTKIEMRIARAREIPEWLPHQNHSTNSIEQPSPPVESADAPSNSPTTESSSGRSPILDSGLGDPYVLGDGTPVEQAQQAIPTPVDANQQINLPISIGLVWESSDPQLDVDLYVKVAGRPELSFRQTRSSAGEYVHDWRQPNAGSDHEWVVVSPPVRLSEITAWANLFRGRGPISGQVAIHFDYKTYVGLFTIGAPHGNKGMDGNYRESSANWTRIDIANVVAGTD